MNVIWIDTPLGSVRIVSSGKGVREIQFVDEEYFEDTCLDEYNKLAADEIAQYFQDTLKEFTFPMDLEGTDFQKRVWEKLTHIPFGDTRSYLSLADELGDIKAIRAVAKANGANPIAIAVPCHRVIGSDGSLVGYAGGLYRKSWLLDLESGQRRMF
jgi:methylated-DNA-[protein]-cysteine S-methyltransferase